MIVAAMSVTVANDIHRIVYLRNSIRMTTMIGDRSRPPIAGTTLRMAEDRLGQGDQDAQHRAHEVVVLLMTLKAVSQLTITATITTHS